MKLNKLVCVCVGGGYPGSGDDIFFCDTSSAGFFALGLWCDPHPKALTIENVSRALEGARL